MNWNWGCSPIWASASKRYFLILIHCYSAVLWVSIFPAQYVQFKLMLFVYCQNKVNPTWRHYRLYGLIVGIETGIASELQYGKCRFLHLVKIDVWKFSAYAACTSNIVSFKWIYACTFLLQSQMRQRFSVSSIYAMLSWVAAGPDVLQLVGSAFGFGLVLEIQFWMNAAISRDRFIGPWRLPMCLLSSLWS